MQIVPKQPGCTPQHQLLLSRRTFTFSAQALRRLKQRLTATRPEFAGAAPPSTFATLAAHGWVCLALASGFTDAAPVFAVFASDQGSKFRRNFVEISRISVISVVAERKI